MSKGTRWCCRVAAVSCVALAVVALASGAHAQQKLKVYVSTGFDGNTWMNASTNLLRAIAQTKAYKDRVHWRSNLPAVMLKPSIINPTFLSS